MEHYREDEKGRSILMYNEIIFIIGFYKFKIGQLSIYIRVMLGI